ncbi:MAG: DNA gyrase subunit A [Patescibacteria group bacterium]
MEIGYIKPREITREMQESYLDYAMSVIISRALPDVRDGLKPVHRRILYAMWDMGLKSGAKFRKSATVVGETLGKYHPHGDIAVYDSLVRMAQDFNMRYPLIFGQGNFGSLDGDSQAAMRYTEVKLSKISEELLYDLEKETVKFVDNYDATQKEPQVLPAKLPNILLNGSMGIAVGMATNIPPHNLSEVADGIIHLVDNKNADVEDLMKYIQGPDFPTGGFIFNKKDILQVYAQGKGAILMRGRAEIVENKKGNYSIVISEIPYQVNKAALVEKIANLVHEKKLEGIRDVRDESDKEGIRIVIDLKREAFPKKILNRLYTLTQLQEKFHVNMLALAENGLIPRVLNLKSTLELYIKHRQEIVKARTAYDLKKAKERAHILEGLKKALDRISEVIKTIKQSKTKEIAQVNLVKKFHLTKIQAQAILDMKLSQLAALERKKIEDELKEKKKLIKELESILASPKKILNLIKNELEELKGKYGDERKTKVIVGAAEEFTAEDLVPKEDVVITLTYGGYIKSLPVGAYRAQHRGGKGVRGMEMREEDVIEHCFITDTHSNILFFTNSGKVFQLKAYEIPKSSRAARGQSMVNFLQLSQGERISALVPLKKGVINKYLAFVTKNGLIKKVDSEDFKNVRRSGLIAIKLKKSDELEWVKPTSGQDEIILVTSLGQSIRFKEKDIRKMGRQAAGIRGIRLKGKDQVVGMDVIETQNSKLKTQNLLIVTENGFGKKSALKFYKVQRRGGSGIKTAKITPKNGKIIFAKILDEEIEEIIVISKKGLVIRVDQNSISPQGRATQGVRIMRLKTGDKVASVAYI